MMEQDKRICVLHVGNLVDAPIVLFTEETFRKCKESENVYKARSNPCVLSYLEVPSNLDNSSGYHTTCYRRCTATSKKQKEIALQKLARVEPTSTERATPWR